jgi:short-subunit dehydrogenase
MTNTWVILGASSAMARGFARAVAKTGAAVVLAGRDMDDLKRMAADCTLRGAAEAEALAYDARDAKSDQTLFDLLDARSGTLNIAVFVGSMPEQEAIDADPALIAGTVTDSFTGPARTLTTLLPLLEARGDGAIVGVSSVAGDRGRVGNYVYGAAKAGFATYLSGLRNRAGRKGVHVMTVKPGFVDSAMTWGLPGMFLVASPDDVARAILKALGKGRNVIYTPFFWRYIMLIIRHVPEMIFKKMSI